MSENWKEKIIEEKLGGKVNWTDEERQDLCKELDSELENHITSLEKTKIKDGWTEENWKEKMAEHPLFASYVQPEGIAHPEAPINPLSEGLAQLKYDPDHNSPSEVAHNYKEEGIYQFKFKKYNLAIANFTEGLKQLCTDVELNAQLLNNRAAANYNLENYRSAIKDCEKAIELKPDYMKAIIRAAKSAVSLKSWSEVISFCDMGLQICPQDKTFISMRSSAVKEQKILDRDIRKKALVERQTTIKEQELLNMIMARNITLSTEGIDESSVLSLAALEPCHPAALGSKVHLNENGQIVWPVMFLYPEYQETDFICEFNETDCILQHLEIMFGDNVPPAPWDHEKKYRAPNLLVYFEDAAKTKLCHVNPSNSLMEIICDQRYGVAGGTPTFIILVKDSKFAKEFLKKYAS